MRSFDAPRKSDPQRSAARRPVAAPTGSRRAAVGLPVQRTQLADLQRLVGNRATTEMVQRATATEVSSAKAKADTDFGAGNTADYFAGNFLANHIETVSEEVRQASGGAGVMSKGKKAARGQAYAKLADRANVEDGGSGWGPKKKTAGLNTLILDYGPQLKFLMRAVNVAQIDQLATKPVTRFFEFETAENVRAVTYGSNGERNEQKGKAHLGAQYDPALDRYQINHLSGIN